MLEAISTTLFALAAIGLAALLVQHGALRSHLRRPGAPVRGDSLDPGPARPAPPISILKPLCGDDDDLAANLAAFAALDYPAYEVLLGVKSARDPAFAPALAAVRRWPGRMRLVLQRFDEGLNPKVNQLVGLARAARHDLLLISDSNVRVGAGYLRGVGEAMSAPGVGLVTHPVVGAGERRLGALLENLHLAGAVGPGMVAAQRLSGRAVVVGKSMALWRADVERLGGFESMKDVLAEDHLLGVRVADELGKRVVVARAPVVNVNQDRSVRAFHGRYARWSVLQRKLVGTPVFAAQALLNPVLLAALGALAERDARAGALLAAVCAAKCALDGASARLLRPGGFRLRALLLVPLKDLVLGAAWAQGLVSDQVDWRGHRLRVLPGTRLAAVEGEGEEALGAEA
ncbi:MAG: glycosyltransferase [Anaeromyxobacter sp.]